MNIKGNLLEFSVKEEGIDQTFAINLLNISHYYLFEDKDEILNLRIYFNGRNEPETFYGGNADVIARAISEAMSNGVVHELELELEGAN